MKQKTNRDALFGLCVYDLLCRINNGLRKIDGGDVCVVDALTGHFTRCPEYCTEKLCEKCILEYLDEEAKA